MNILISVVITNFIMLVAIAGYDGHCQNNKLIDKHYKKCCLWMVLTFASIIFVIAYSIIEQLIK